MFYNYLTQHIIEPGKVDDSDGLDKGKHKYVPYNANVTPQCPNSPAGTLRPTRAVRPQLVGMPQCSAELVLCPSAVAPVVKDVSGCMIKT